MVRAIAMADVQWIILGSSLQPLTSSVCDPVCPGSTLCEECVGQRCRVLRLKNQLAEDYKEVTNLVKGPPKR